MSNKKEEVRITATKKLEKKGTEQKDKKSTLNDDSSMKSLNFSREPKLKPILISTTPGVIQLRYSLVQNAIMGYVKEETPVPKKLPPLKENINKSINSELDSRIENTMITLLETKCFELGKEIEDEKAKRKEIEVDNALLKSSITNLEKDLRTLRVEINEEKNDRTLVESDLEGIKEALNKSKRELGKVNQELQTANHNCHQLQLDLQEANVQKTTDKQLYEQEIKMLRTKIEEIEEENEELKTKFQIKSEIDTRVDEESNHFIIVKLKGANLIRQIQKKSLNEAENKLEKITKLISENAILDEKLKESESLRRKYMEKAASQEEKIKVLFESNKTLTETVNILKKQIADVKSIKSHNHKIYDDKIHTLTHEIDKLKKENEHLKKIKAPTLSLKSKDNEEESLLEPVQAKPFLFGPVDNGKY